MDGAVQFRDALRSPTSRFYLVSKVVAETLKTLVTNYFLWERFFRLNGTQCDKNMHYKSLDNLQKISQRLGVLLGLNI